MPLVEKNVSHLVLIGEATERICAAWPDVAISRASSLDEAIALALARAPEQGTVLLSPGCTSFDMFRSFEERGDQFRQLVQARIRADNPAAGTGADQG